LSKSTFKTESIVGKVIYFDQKSENKRQSVINTSVMFKIP